MGRSVQPLPRSGNGQIIPRRDPSGRRGEDRPLLLDVRTALLLNEDHRRCPGVRREECIGRTVGPRARNDRKIRGVQEEGIPDLSLGCGAMRTEEEDLLEQASSSAGPTYKWGVGHGAPKEKIY